MKIAFIIFSVNSLSGGGGAERRYPIIAEELAKDKFGQVYLIMDSKSHQNYIESGFLNNKNNIIIKTYDLADNRFYRIINTYRLLKILWSIKSDIVQLCKLSPFEYYYCKNLIKYSIGKKILSIEHCRFVYDLESINTSEKKDNSLDKLLSLNWDGVFTHYNKFKEVFENSKYNNGQSVFVSPCGFTSKQVLLNTNKKEKLIVFAARLDKQKGPIIFLKAIKELHFAGSLSDWKILILGKGEQEQEVRDFIFENSLENVVSINFSPDIQTYFERSRIFVSMQDYENFPSFSMIDAMAAGNMIIARNVGETNRLVLEGINGFLTSAEGNNLPEILSHAISLPENIQLQMMNKSRSEISKKHSLVNYITSYKDFLANVL